MGALNLQYGDVSGPMLEYFWTAKKSMMLALGPLEKYSRPASKKEFVACQITENHSQNYKSLVLPDLRQSLEGCNDST